MSLQDVLYDKWNKRRSHNVKYKCSYSFMGRVDMSCKVMRSDGLGLSVSANCVGKYSTNYIQYFLTGVLPFVHVVS